MRPDRFIVVNFASRGVRLWVGTRLLGSAVVGLAGMNPLFLGFWSSCLFVAVCLALGLADIRRRHERALLANLAVPPLANVAFFAIPAFIGESAIAAIGSLVA
jgi:hypothetical protein